MRRLPKRLKALPADIGYSFKALGKRVSGVGVNAFAQQVIAGFFTNEIKKMRLDQLQTVLMSGVFVNQLIDEDHLPERWTNIIRILGRFTDLESLSERIPDLMTPELIANALRGANPEAFSLIINSDAGGIKWFVDQSYYSAQKLQRIVRRVAHGG